MADLTPQERLQPSLLDRLTDDKPEGKQESRDARVMSLKKLREAVVRDLTWLLNSGNLSGTENLEAYPEVARSVLNYGMPDLSGCTASSVDATEMERVLRQCIWDFEPRILRHTVKVRVVVADDQMNRNALTFEIEGQLWAEPVPEQLFLETSLDLETGNVTVEEHTGSRSS
jgi:type VI secretion system protein ImpF